VNSLSITAIQEKLNANLDRYPPPLSPEPKRRTEMWGRSSVLEIPHNPKYTGFMVWNRRGRRLVTNLEGQEADSEIAVDIRARLEELGTVRAKKQRALEAAEKERAQVPDPRVG
jgi:hypothetical protein